MMECPYCFYQNDDSADSCENCEALLKRKITRIRTKLSLINFIKNERIDVSNDGTLGREGDITSPCIQNDMTISRYHLKLENSKGKWQVSHLGKNPTLLNGISLDRGLITKIRNNDIINVGNQLFSVSLSEVSVKYAITCPACEHKYYVSSPDEHINVCTRCDDDDKFMIASVDAEEVIEGED